jgi:carboxyl-terminal processing protease
LTTARYYTPSGRCIQKDYKEGMLNYEKELIDRYTHGELYSRDSMKVDKSQVFTTTHGRTVYGGGGIVPDIFVARDTSGITNYYIEVANAGLLQRYAFNYCNNHRDALNKMEDYNQFLRTAPSDDALTKDFADYAAANGIAPRWYYISLSQNVIVTNLKALIARDTFGNQAFYPIINRNDNTVQAALKAMNKHKAAFPITD